MEYAGREHGPPEIAGTVRRIGLHRFELQERISGLVPQWKANRRNSRGRQLPNRRLWLQLASAGKEYAKVVPCR
jgi:hypothetical protein